MTTIDEAVDTTPPDVDDSDGDGEEWHGLNVTAIAHPDGTLVEIQSCPELTEEQLIQLVDRAASSLWDMRRELLEAIGRRS